MGCFDVWRRWLRQLKIGGGGCAAEAAALNDLVNDTAVDAIICVRVEIITALF